MFSNQLTFVHASTVNNCKYMITSLDFKEAFTRLHTWISFFWHIHLQTIVMLSEKQVRIIHINTTKSLFYLCPNKRYFINPVSVGQPRDGNPRAAFAIYDSKRKCVSFFFASHMIMKALQRNSSIFDYQEEWIKE